MNARTALLARSCACAGVAAGIFAFAAALHAQGLSALSPGPIALADGHVTIGGDVSASFGSDDVGFFNYTDYEHSALRMVRVNVSAAIKAGDHFSILADLQTENFDGVTPYALYARIRPWTDRDIDIQVGRVPPTFGGFARRTYVSQNPLIGYPLGYQYLTSLRPDALPATVDELLQKKSFGWLVRYSVGDPSADHGVPAVSGFRWDTGIQVHAALLDNRALSATASVTNGTISNPLFADDNGGKQFAARMEWRPHASFAVGSSVSRGAFVSDDAARAAMGTTEGAGRFTQGAWGADAEYSRDYYVVRAEFVASDWRIPLAKQPDWHEALTAYSTSIEGKYTIQPGLYAAARFDRLAFNKITGTEGTVPWDAPVTRIEVGSGYYLARNLIVKVSYQHNSRDGGRLLQSAHLIASQVVFWF